MMAALAALVASASAGAAAAATPQAKKQAKAPVITKVAPMDVAVGEWLTIRGRHFVRGTKKNTVVFKRAGARAVFVKAEYGTAKLLKVTVPASLQEVFLTKNNVPRRRASSCASSPRSSARSSRPRTRSPVVAPRARRSRRPVRGRRRLRRRRHQEQRETDDDDDLLPDTLEAQINTDACNIDTDGDGVQDGFEYQSALDLNDDEYQQPNGTSLPGQAPLPEPALRGDQDTDFDGDTLTLAEEQAAVDLHHNVATPSAHADAAVATPTASSTRLSVATAPSRPPPPTLTAGDDDKRRVPRLGERRRLRRVVHAYPSWWTRHR